jgi:hypothetical protein
VSARFVTQHEREHVERSGCYGAMAVARPRHLAPRPGDHHVAADPLAAREQRQKVASRNELRHEVVLELFPQRIRRLIEQSAGSRPGRSRRDDAIDRTSERAQRFRQRRATRVAVERGHEGGHAGLAAEVRPLRARLVVDDQYIASRRDCGLRDTLRDHSGAYDEECG